MYEYIIVKITIQNDIFLLTAHEVDWEVYPMMLIFFARLISHRRIIFLQFKTYSCVAAKIAQVGPDPFKYQVVFT